MIDKETSKVMQEVLNYARKGIESHYEAIEAKFKHLLRTNGDFIPEDHSVLYTGNDYPITCKVMKVRYEKSDNTIMVTLRDEEYMDTDEFDFEVNIHELEPLSLYGEHILLLYGQAINYFTK